MTTRMATVMMVLVLAGVGGSACKSFKESYKKSFVENWHQSFIKSCIGDQQTEEQEALCTCVADKAVAELSVKELHDPSRSTQYLTEKIVPVCRDELEL